jgi:hypothetical protein
MAPDPNRQLLEFGPMADVELDNSPEDEMASPETSVEGADDGRARDDAIDNGRAA